MRCRDAGEPAVGRGRELNVRAAVFVMAAVLAASLAYGLARMPVQVSDSLGEILDAERSPSIAASFGSTLGGNVGYLRPMRIAQIKALFDLAGGRYQLVYRGFHVLLLVALLLLFARALRVETGADVAAAAFALAVLTGMHTFVGFVREAYPVNHFLEIAVFCLAALNLSLSRGGWWVDAAAALVFVMAALILESGLLVWVVVAGAWICGFRGISARGVALVTALLAGYMAVRFGYAGAGVPSLGERASGFLFERLEPAELEARFGDRRLSFYAYNVAASLLSVLAAEPREGVWVGLGSWLDGRLQPRTVLAVGSSLATTGLIAWWAAARWRDRELGHPDRLALVSAAVIPANAALSFAYTKDVIVAVAGVFYAFMAYAALRVLFARTARARPAAIVAASLLLVVLSSAWAIRSAGVHHIMRRQAFRERVDWALVGVEWERAGRRLEGRAAAIVDQLQREALEMSVPNPQRLPAWTDAWFGD